MIVGTVFFSQLSNTKTSTGAKAACASNMCGGSGNTCVPINTKSGGLTCCGPHFGLTDRAYATWGATCKSGSVDCPPNLQCNIDYGLNLAGREGWGGPANYNWKAAGFIKCNGYNAAGNIAPILCCPSGFTRDKTNGEPGVCKCPIRAVCTCPSGLQCNIDYGLNLAGREGWGGPANYDWKAAGFIKCNGYNAAGNVAPILCCPLGYTRNKTNGEPGTCVTN